MNVMLVAGRQRTAEVGLLKALGARGQPDPLALVPWPKQSCCPTAGAYRPGCFSVTRGELGLGARPIARRCSGRAALA